jgi:protein-disulfide isomerase
LNIPISKNQWDTDYSLRPTKNDYEKLKKDRDDLLIKLNQKPKDDISTLSKRIAEEINKAYKAPRYLFSYYLKLMNTFKDWEIYGNDDQKQASQQNKNELEKVITFLTSYQSQNI